MQLIFACVPEYVIPGVNFKASSENVSFFLIAQWTDISICPITNS